MPTDRLADLRAAFDRFARVKAPGLASPTYEELDRYPDQLLWLRALEGMSGTLHFPLPERRKGDGDVGRCVAAWVVD